MQSTLQRAGDIPCISTFSPQVARIERVLHRNTQPSRFSLAGLQDKSVLLISTLYLLGVRRRVQTQDFSSFCAALHETLQFESATRGNVCSRRRPGHTHIPLGSTADPASRTHLVFFLYGNQHRELLRFMQLVGRLQP